MLDELREGEATPDIFRVNLYLRSDEAWERYQLPLARSERQFLELRAELNSVTQASRVRLPGK